MDKNKDLVTFEFPAEPKSAKLLREFVKYCKEHPEERFWQALRNWAGVNFLWVSKFRYDDYRYCESLKSFTNEIEDTFYWEKKNG